MQLSDRQKQFLRRAEAGDVNMVLNGLYNLIREKEPLDPRWKTIWLKHRELAVSNRLVPPDIVDTIDSQISQLEPIENDILRLRLKQEDKVCILLGAGASSSAPSSIPTVTQLLPELWRRARKLGRDDINKLAVWCDSHGIKNIEDLLTAAYLSNFAAKNNSVSSLLDYFLFAGQRAEMQTDPLFRGRRTLSTPAVDTSSIALLQETLQMLFGLLTGTMIPAPPNEGHHAILNFVKQHTNTSIVTTNYDGCVDEALLRGGLSLNSFLGDEQKNQPAVDLIKIHGSINWAHCDSCHTAKEFDLLKLKDEYDKDSISYPVIGICRSCGGQRRPLLIPPMGFKFVLFPDLIRLWHSAGKAIEEAKIIIVVGFSFSEADSYINKIIARSMTRKPGQKIIVCDPNHNLVPTLHEKFSSYIDDFDTARIMKATDTSDKVLPRILAALVSADKPPEQETKSAQK